MLLQSVRTKMAYVQPDMAATFLPHLCGNSTRHNIAWSQLRSGVVIRHEAATLLVQQMSTLTTQGFG
jgi:hypothetical protein